jgi:D-aspartate ligase
MPARHEIAEELKGETRVTRPSAATTGALLMGADYRALGVARSLGRRGIPVWVIKQGGHFVAAASYYVSHRVSWPETDERAQVDFLLALSARHQLKEWLLVPTDDYAVMLVARHHRRLADYYRLTIPPWDDVQWACDKRLLHRLAQRLGIHAPWTICPLGREDLLPTDYPFPVVLKPAVRVQPSTLAIPKAWLVEDAKTLLARYDEATQLMGSGDLIVQEVVPGGGEAQFSYAALCREGVALASIVARRTRQFPRDFGQFSTYVETVDEPGVIEPAERLLAAKGFTGLVEVEFKRDPRDGRFKILDVNPRVWGWHTLGGRAGVDFPYLLWLLATGGPIPRLRGSAGKRWIHLSGDLRVASEEILRRRLSLADYLRSFRGPLETAIFAWDDPLPALLDLPLFAWAAGRRKLTVLMRENAKPKEWGIAPSTLTERTRLSAPGPSRFDSTPEA